MGFIRCTELSRGCMLYRDRRGPVCGYYWQVRAKGWVVWCIVIGPGWLIGRVRAVVPGLSRRLSESP